MRKILELSLLLALMACVNDGDFAQLNGTWHLETIDVDGLEQQDYAGNVFWKFQEDVIDMVETDDVMHERKDHYGTWHTEGESLVLDFVHGEDRFPPGSEDYVPPAVTGLPSGKIILEVVKLSGGKMQLTYRDEKENKTKNYTLKKQ